MIVRVFIKGSFVISVSIIYGNFQSHLVTWIMKPSGVEQKGGECDKGGKATQQRPEN